MKEKASRKLMELFAIAASMNEQGLSYRSRTIVESYTKYQLLSVEKTDHLLPYVHYLKEYLEIGNAEPGSKLERVRKVCFDLNKELASKERIIVLLHIFDIAVIDHKISESEKALIDAVVDEFKISTDELDDLTKLVFWESSNELPGKNFLSVQENKTDDDDDLEGSWIEQHKPKELEKEKVRIILRSGFKGHLFLTYLPSINAFAFKHKGESELQVNGREIQTGRLYLLDIDGKISGKNLEPILFNELQPIIQPSDLKGKISLECRNLSYTYTSSEFQIKPFSVTTESGRMIAILGEKNSGKSTLLKILGGELRNYTGKVQLNGYELKLEWFKLRNIIGHVPENDIIINELSVFDNFYYNARLCFSSLPETEIRARLDKLFDFLDIEDVKYKNPQKSRLSPFIRKKINLGLELLKDPQILLLDEPAAGLSSSEAESIAKLLKILAISGKLIIASMHHAAPRAFRVFQDVWILDDEGYIIYTGPIAEALNYFNAESRDTFSPDTACENCRIYDPEIIFENIRSRKINEKGHFITERKKSPHEWHQLYKEKIEKNVQFHEARKVLPQVLFMNPNLGIQSIIYTLRYLKIWSNSRWRLALSLLLPPLIALILALLTRYSPRETYSFSQNVNIPLYFFLSLLVALVMGMLMSAEELIRYRLRMQREEVITLTRIGCLNVRVFFLIMLAAIQSFIFVIVGNFVLQIKDMTIISWLVFFSVASFGMLLALVLSATFRSRLTVYALITIIIIPEILLGGMAIDFAHYPNIMRNDRFVPLISELMVTRWGFEVLMVNQYKENPYEHNYFDIDRNLNQNQIYAEIIIPALQAKVLDCIQNLEKDKRSDRIKNELILIHNEIRHINKSTGIFPFEFIADLETSRFKENIGEEALNYLAFIRNRLYENNNQLQKRRDSVEFTLVKKYGNTGLENLKNLYYNETISTKVKKLDSETAVKEAKDRFIPQKFPVYVFPDAASGRAHLFAPIKLLNGQYINTEWFNLLMIGLLSFAMYILLISDIAGIAYTLIERMIPKRTA